MVEQIMVIWVGVRGFYVLMWNERQDMWFMGKPGWLSPLSVWLLFSAQVMISGSWDQALHQALRCACGSSLRRSISHSLWPSPPASHSLSLKKKDKTKKPPQRYIFYMYRNWSISYNLYSKEKKKYIHLLDYIGIKNLQELKQEMDRTDVSGDAGPWGGFILFCTLCTFWFWTMWIFNLFKTIQFMHTPHRSYLAFLVHIQWNVNVPENDQRWQWPAIYPMPAGLHTASRWSSNWLWDQRWL